MFSKIRYGSCYELLIGDWRVGRFKRVGKGSNEVKEETLAAVYSFVFLSNLLILSSYGRGSL